MPHNWPIKKNKLH